MLCNNKRSILNFILVANYILLSYSCNSNKTLPTRYPNRIDHLITINFNKDSVNVSVLSDTCKYFTYYYIKCENTLKHPIVISASTNSGDLAISPSSIKIDNSNNYTFEVQFNKGKRNMPLQREITFKVEENQKELFLQYYILRLIILE